MTALTNEIISPSREKKKWFLFAIISLLFFCITTDEKIF